MEALVAVQAHLRNRLFEAPQKLRYQLVMDPAGTWKIADIVYSDPTISQALIAAIALQPIDTAVPMVARKLRLIVKSCVNRRRIGQRRA